MKTTLTCIFPSEQCAFVATNRVKESGYEIEKVHVSPNNNIINRGRINASSGFYEYSYLPFTQSGPGQTYPEEGNTYPAGQIASVAAALGFENGINPFKEELPKEISDALPTSYAFMRCNISSHQTKDISKLLSENGGENIKIYSN